MSLVADVADYIASEISDWIVDTNLFMSDEPPESPDKCLIVRASPGGKDHESSLKERAIQVIAKNIAPVTCEEDIEEVYNVLANKPGFDGISNIFYCEALNPPYPVTQDDRGRWVFVFNLLFRKL